MSSSRAFRTLWRRELKSLLRSLFGWAIIAAFAAAVGGLLLFSLWHLDGRIVRPPRAPCVPDMALALPPPLAFATMRSFAEERQNGTLEGLLTVPVPDSAIVWAKFAGAYTVVVLAIAAAVGSFAVYAEYVHIARDYRRTGIASATAILLLHAASLTALGILVSLYSRRPGIAAIATLALSIPPVLFLAGTFAPAGLPAWFDRLDICAIADGVVDSRPVVFALSTLFFFLFASIRALESRRWKL